MIRLLAWEIPLLTSKKVRWMHFWCQKITRKTIVHREHFSRAKVVRHGLIVPKIYSFTRGVWAWIQLQDVGWTLQVAEVACLGGNDLIFVKEFVLFILAKIWLWTYSFLCFRICPLKKQAGLGGKDCLVIANCFSRDYEHSIGDGTVLSGYMECTTFNHFYSLSSISIECGCCLVQPHVLFYSRRIFFSWCMLTCATYLASVKVGYLLSEQI